MKIRKSVLIITTMTMLLGLLYSPLSSAQAVTVKQANKLSHDDRITFVESWYYGLTDDSVYQKENDRISKKKTKELGEDLSDLISDEFKLKKDKSFKKVKYNKSTTRKYVIHVLYNAVGQYKLPNKLNRAKTGSIDYFVERGLLTKNKKKQYLSKECTIAQALVWATELFYDIVDIKNEGSKGFFWKATKGHNTVYLLGSIHVGVPMMYPVNAEIRNAIRETDKLYVECNTNTEQGQADYLAKAMYTDGTTLKDHISNDTYEELEKICNKYGMNIEVLNKLKPWLVASNIRGFYEYDTESVETISYYSLLGVDNYFMDIAEKSDIPIGELETVTGQLDIFDTMTPQQQEEYLAYYIDKVLYSSAEEREAFTIYRYQMWFSWCNGDYKYFKENFTNTSDSDLGDQLTGERDTAMADKISGLLEEDNGMTYFVVIGSAHVETDGLVVDQLKEKGYNVTRVN